MKGSILLKARHARIMLALAALLAGFVSLPAGAAEHKAPKAERYANVTWYRVDTVRYKNGHMHDALRIIRKYFLPASHKSGNTPMILVHRSGISSVTFIWKMKHGIDEMDWKTSPWQVRFFKALSEAAGSPEKARKIFASYENDIAEDNDVIAMQEPGLR